jgi:hypothetical protein
MHERKQTHTHTHNPRDPDTRVSENDRPPSAVTCLTSGRPDQPAGPSAPRSLRQGIFRLSYRALFPHAHPPTHPPTHLVEEHRVELLRLVHQALEGCLLQIVECKRRSAELPENQEPIDWDMCDSPRGRKAAGRSAYCEPGPALTDAMASESRQVVNPLRFVGLA